MNEVEYRTKRNEIVTRYKNDLISLDRQYALSNNPYSIGDRIKDHFDKIIIEKITVCAGSDVGFGNRLPMCKYFGNIINKDGSMRKQRGMLGTDHKRVIYQNNIVK